MTIHSTESLLIGLAFFIVMLIYLGIQPDYFRITVIKGVKKTHYYAKGIEQRDDLINLHENDGGYCTFERIGKKTYEAKS